MVFKRPGNSRDDKSTNQPRESSRGDNNSRKASSSGRGKSTSDSFNKTGSDRPKRSYSRESGSEGKPFSSDRNKSYGNRSESGDKPKSTFNKGAYGDKKSFSSPKSKPYSGRPDSEERPKSRYGEQAGEKKSFSSPKSKPYSGRPTSDERPKSRYGEQAGEKKSFSSPRKTYPERPDSNERPKRVSREDSAGDRPFNAKRSEDRKFGDKTSGGFKRKSSDFKDKPFRKSDKASKPSYSKTDREQSPERVMRGRKNAPDASKGLIRLNRYISNAGICSRRKADELISAGVVSVNGEVVSELGYKVDPTKDIVKYNGETLKREKMVYVLLNKPKDYITTTEDPQERRTVMHLVEKASRERIYPIGRLDRNTTGLLLMTNDGDLADKLSHPKNNITKIYHVELSKSLTQGDLNKISFGLELEDGLIKPDSISYVQGASKKEVGIQIHSGKNRIVRRIFEHLGYEVVKLDRAVYANLTKKDLPRGRWRYLDEQEVIQLKHLI